MNKYLVCSHNILFNIEDGYYYIRGNYQPFITEDEAIEALED